jgi:AAA+ ATPase superfamily predicted ATPase
LSDPTSALVVIGERMLAAEFPELETARAALEAVGHGERSFSALSDRSGLSGTSLHRALALLRRKRVIEGEDPLSVARGGRATRYRVADPYLRFWLRFWLRFIGPALADVERGRADLAITRAEDGWPSYRGRAVEPLVRQSLERLAPVPGLGGARDFGGYWTRANDVEVDLVGVADRKRVQHIDAVGSIKWRDEQPFSTADATNLRRGASIVPGADDTTNLVAVSRSGFVDELGEVVRLGPDDLLSAWSG